jgi:hypothetical protein
MHLWRSVKRLVHIGAYIRLFIRFSGYWKFVLDTPGQEVSQAFIITEAQAKSVDILLGGHDSSIHL